jgi:FkbM family methyltransferase
MPPTNKSYSQYGQDTLIARICGHKTRGTFLEIGAFDGETFSNTALLERHYGWRGICIEPLPDAFAQLKASRGCICVNAAAGAQSGGKVQFEAIEGYGAMLSGTASTRHAAHEARIASEQRLHQFGRRTIEVDVVRAADLLRQHGMTTVDFASIDVEGAELQCLQGLLVPGVTVRLLAVENNYGEAAVPRFLKDLGYMRLTMAGGDDIWHLRSECGLWEWGLRLLSTPRLLKKDYRHRRNARRFALKNRPRQGGAEP